MKDFRSRKKTYNFLQSPIILVILFLVLVLLSRSAYISYGKKKNADIEQQRFNEKHEELLQKRDNLIEKNKILKTDAGVVEELRKTFNIGESGESIIHITESRE